MEFKINSAACRIEEGEGKLYEPILKFLEEKYRKYKRPKNQETQQSGYGKLDVHVIDENEKKIGVEVKPYFTILGAEGAKAFGQALLCKARSDVNNNKMFVAFPMSDSKDDTKKLIGNFEKNKPRLRRFQKIWEKLGLEGELENLSLMDINKQIYKKAYSNIGIGVLGIMGTVKDGKFELEKDPVKELYPPLV